MALKKENYINLLVIGGWLGTLITIAYNTKAVGMITFVLLGAFYLLYKEEKHDRSNG